MVHAVRHWFLFGFRPKTWVALLAPVSLSAFWVFFAFPGLVDLVAGGVALVSGLFIQISTNLFNDYFDHLKGTDSAERVGPTRLLQSGQARPDTVRRVAFLFLVLAAGGGAYLVWLGGWIVAVIGILSLILAYAYSGGPRPLTHLGLGEPFVIVFFGIIPTLVTAFLMTHQDGGRWFSELWYFGVATGLLASGLILMNNIRDIEIDTRSGRKTLPIRMGMKKAKIILLCMLLLSHVLPSIYFWLVGGKWLVLLPLVNLRYLGDSFVDFWRAQTPYQFAPFFAKLIVTHWRWLGLQLLGIYLCFISGIKLMIF